MLEMDNAEIMMHTTRGSKNLHSTYKTAFSLSLSLLNEEEREKMIALKTIQPSFTATKHAFLHMGRPFNTKSSFLCLCKPNDSNSEASPPEGDTRKQELLARIAMLQAQKVRLTDYLDERSAYLTQFGEEAIAEFDKIGEDALKGLDEAGARVC
jgi:hypothetical protein